MRVFFKITGITLGVFLGVSLLLAGFIYYSLSDSRLRPMINRYLSEHLHRPASIGTISVQLYPPLSLHIRDITIANRTDSAFTQEKPMLRLGDLELKIRLWSLFSDQIDIDAVTLTDLYFLLESDPSERSNLDSLFKASEETPNDTEATPSLDRFRLLVQDIRLTNMTYEQRSAASPFRFALEGLQGQVTLASKATLRHLEIGAAGTVDAVSFSNSFGTLLDSIPATFETLFDLDLDLGSLIFSKGEGQVGLLPIFFSGRMDSLLNDRRFFDLHLHAPKTDFGNLLSLLPYPYSEKVTEAQTSGLFELGIDIEGPFSKTELPAIALLFELEKGSIAFKGLPKRISLLEFKGEATSSYFDLSRFSAVMGDNRLSGTLNVTNFANPSLRTSLNGSVNLSELQQFYPLEKGTSLSGKVSASLSLQALLSKPKEAKGSGTLSLQTIQYLSPRLPAPIHDLSGELRLSNERLSLSPLTLVIGESDFRFSGELSNYLALISTSPSTPALFKGNLTSRKVDLNTLISPKETTKDSTASPLRLSSLPFPALDGTFTLSIDTLLSSPYVISTLRGGMGYRDRVVELTRFNFSMLGASFSTSGNLNLKIPEDPRFGLTFSISKLPIESAFEQFSSLSAITGLSGYLSGMSSLSFSANGALTDSLSPVLQSLNANGLFEISTGRLNALPIQERISSLVKIQELRNYEFEQWKNSFEVRAGRLYVRGLNFSIGKSRVEIAGSQGLDGSLDYALLLQLDERLSGNLDLMIGSTPARFLKDQSGRIPIEFKIGGQFTSPQVSLSQESLLARAKAAVIAEAKLMADSLKREAEVRLNAERERLEAEAKARIEDERNKLESAARQKAEEEKRKLEEKAKENLRRFLGRP